MTISGFCFSHHQRRLGLGLSAAVLLSSLVAAQADPWYAGEGIDMGHMPKSYIFHMKPIDITADFNETSWTQYWSSGLAVPGANLTGMRPDAQPTSNVTWRPSVT